jgi:hypothetical protein
MDKEQQKLLDEAYENYTQTNIVKNDDGTETHTSPAGHYNGMTKEGFINKIKTHPEFSEKWGLKIEERELSWEERRDLLTPEQYDGTALNKYGHKDCGFGYISPFTDKVIHYWMNLHNIPTKQITLTYNNTTIESYES